MKILQALIAAAVLFTPMASAQVPAAVVAPAAVVDTPVVVPAPVVTQLYWWNKHEYKSLPACEKARDNHKLYSKAKGTGVGAVTGALLSSHPAGIVAMAALGFFAGDYVGKHTGFCTAAGVTSSRRVK